jgi:hypothetical protein
MLFSQRYFPAIENKVLVFDIPDAARRKLWAWLSANNASLGILRDPNDSWISNSSVLGETVCVTKVRAACSKLGFPSNRSPLLPGARIGNATPLHSPEARNTPLNAFRPGCLTATLWRINLVRVAHNTLFRLYGNPSSIGGSACISNRVLRPNT